MAWSAPTYTGGVVWEDAPSENTPLNAADLNTEENAEAAYAAQVGQSVANYVDAETARAQAAEASKLAKASNLSDVADADSSRANLKVPVLRHAQCVSTTNRALSGALPTIDGYAVQDGDRVLLAGQTTASENGPWIAHVAGWVRPNDYPHAAVLTSRSCKVTGGTVYGATDWLLASTANVTVDTTAVTWKQLQPPPTVVSRSSAISSNVVPRIYAPLPTGVAATDTANLNALASPPAPMPGVIVELGAGTYVHNGGLPQNTGVYWEGQGDGITVIQLANGANADLVKSANFDSLVGTNSLLGVTQCGMSKLSLDGNNANNTVGACLKIYGWGFRLKEITVHHAATRNLWTEHGEGGYPADEDTTGVGLEARFDDITSHHAGTDGWYNNGPHDSLGDNIICYRNGAKGYWQGPNAQGFLGGKLHSWGSTHTYAAYLESSCVFTNLIAEGATGAGQVMVGANNIQLKVWAFGNNLTTQKNGILIGDGSHTNVSGYTIEGVLQSFPSGAIQFNSDGGGRIRVLIQGDPNPNQTIVSTGTPAGSTTIDWWTTNNNNVTPSATFPSYVPAALNAFDAFRSSEVATMPRLLAGITSGAPSTTNIVAARAIARSTGTFSKIRACSATAGGTLTDVRLGVWDINGNVLAYTANLVAAGVITNGLLDNQALNVSVALVQGTAVYLGVICLGTTNPTFRGANTGAGAIGAIAPVLTQNNTTTWAGGAPPNITLGGSTFFLPWLELIP